MAELLGALIIYNIWYDLYDRNFALSQFYGLAQQRVLMLQELWTQHCQMHFATKLVFPKISPLKK